MVDYSEVFVGIDVAKARDAVAIADGERGGEVRFLGEIDASTAASGALPRCSISAINSRATRLTGSPASRHRPRAMTRTVSMSTCVSR